MATTKKTTKKTAKEKKAPKERLSKAGKWMRKHPKGFMEILDWEAVLQ